MRVSSSLALSETSGPPEPDIEDTDEERFLGPHQMARESVELRRAARNLTRLRLCWPAQCSPKSILIIAKEPHTADEVQWMDERVAAVSCIVEELSGGVTTYIVNANESTALPDGITTPIDLVITLGGDGTVLTAAWLFQSIVPPILPFHFGTLGFLTVFNYSGAAGHLERIIVPCAKKPRVLLRMRLQCRIFRDNSQQIVYNVLNEVAIDRGPSPHMTVLEVTVDGRRLMTAPADGLVLATPTGSTAYSLSCGGSVVHPDVPAILLTPISPHSLAFRPIILPDTVDLRIRLAESSRAPCACVSFDGRARVELKQGEVLQVRASPFPVPTLCREESQTDDWLLGLANCFKYG